MSKDYYGSARMQEQLTRLKAAMTGLENDINSDLDEKYTEITKAHLDADFEEVFGENGVVGTPTFTREEWNALSTAEKQSYEYVGIIDSEIGFYRGQLVYGRDYVPIGVYLPNTNSNIVLSEAYGDLFVPNSNSWGVGDSPIAFNIPSDSGKPTLNNDSSVAVKTKTYETVAYADLGSDNVAYTAYAVMKGNDITSYGRLIANAETSNYRAFVLYGNPAIVSRWGDAIATNIVSNRYFVCALKYDPTNAQNQQGYSCIKGIAHSGADAGQVILSEAHEAIGYQTRYINLACTSVTKGSNWEPTDVDVKYMAVVNGVETEEDVKANVNYLYNAFVNQ